jgi:lipid-A-disaccharide synthase
MLAADGGLIKSGTSTLEASLLDCPHAVVYRTPWLTSWIFRVLIRYSGPVSLTNLVYGDGAKSAPRLVREWIGGAATEVALMGEVVQILSEPAEAVRQRAGFARVREKLGTARGGSGPSDAAGPSDRAARAVLQVLSDLKKGRPS